MREITAHNLNSARQDALVDFDYGKAIKIYEKYLKNNRLTPKQLCDLGLFYDHRAEKRRKIKYRQQDEKKAMSLYKKALKEKTNLRQGWLGIARIYWHRNSRKSIYYFRKAGQFYPKSLKWQAYQNLANAYFDLNKTAEAKKWYQRALRDGGRGHGFFFNLAKFYYLCGDLKKSDLYNSISLKQLNEYWHSNRGVREYTTTKTFLNRMTKRCL